MVGTGVHNLSATVGRYAPSPTGELHLGNASTALLAWLSARARTGAFRVRMEDLDGPRVVAGSAERILGDLRWLGLDWDEGPDVGGPHAPYEQSARRQGYDEAYRSLLDRGLLYPCFCSRKDIESSASAPQAPGDEIPYPGTCRRLSEAYARARREAEAPHAWRFRIVPGSVEAFKDRVRGMVRPNEEAIGDFVVRRADGVPSYQLAVVVDDAAMAITEVVRGGDLVASTSRQILLYRSLDREPPSFAHVPLLLGADGARLSKRHRGVTLRELRDAGWSPERVVGTIAHLLGLRETDRAIGAGDLLPGFSIGALTAAPIEVRIPAMS